MAPHQVLEFTIGDAQYCIDVEYVTEVVSRSKKPVTSVPDSPSHVEGKVDLRGETARVIDPSAGVLSDEHDGDGPARDRMIVFDTATTTGGRSGWAVTDAVRVSTVDSESVEAVDEDLFRGLVVQEDRQIAWIDPEHVPVEP